MILIIIYNDNRASAGAAMRDSHGIVHTHTAGVLQEGESLAGFERRMKSKAIGGYVEVADLRASSKK